MRYIRVYMYYIFNALVLTGFLPPPLVGINCIALCGDSMYYGGCTELRFGADTEKQHQLEHSRVVYIMYLV